MGVEQNDVMALELNLAAATMGNGMAAFNAGHAFEYGKGTAKDLTRALKYYEIAAESNVVRAMHNAGACYFNGVGTERDVDKAINYYKRAAERGSGLSSFNLGLIFQDDSEGRQDTVIALVCFVLAEAQGFAQAANRVPFLAEQMNSHERAAAINVLEGIARDGIHWAQLALATVYASGVLVDVDHVKAAHWSAESRLTLEQARRMLSEGEN